MTSKLIEELSRFNHWVVYKKEKNREKITKIPYQPNGYKAKPTDPKTWTTYNKAKDAMETDKFDGIGYVLTADQGYICIDLDHCVNPETGDIDQWAMDIIDIVEKAGGTYSESSPSGTGIHLWGRGKLPDNKGIHSPMKNGHDVEMYTNTHYMTVTGEPLNDTPLNDIQPAIDKILTMLKKPPAESGEGKAGTSTPVPVLNLSDDEIITRIRDSDEAPKFHSLYDLGDVSTYGNDQSKADAALLAMLVFWTGKNAEQMKRIFLSSKLAETLGRKVGHEDDYLNRSIKKAIEFVSNVYKPDESVLPFDGENSDLEGGENMDNKKTEKMKWPKQGKTGPLKCVDNLNYLLSEKGITVRWNAVTKKKEFTGSKKLETLDCNVQPTVIRDMTIQVNLNLSKQDTNDFLDLIANENSYSPVCDYLMNCYKNYDGKDYITPLFNMFVLDPSVPQKPEFCKKLFIKWLLECASMPFNWKPTSKPATQQGVLTLVSKEQGIGKTSFPKYTILKDMPEYLITGESIDPENKDSVLRAMGCWVFELSEFEESSSTRKQDALKSFIDRGRDKIRPVYARNEIDTPRTYVFYATTNRTTFMNDATGGRRWWPIAIIGINVDKDFNARQLWGQVMHLLRDKHEKPYLSKEEVRELETHNIAFSSQSDEEMAIVETFDFSKEDNWCRLTAGEVADKLNGKFNCNRYTPKKVGTALTAMNRKDARLDGHKINGRSSYRLPPLQDKAFAAVMAAVTEEEKGSK